MFDKTFAPTIGNEPRRFGVADLERLSRYITLYSLVLVCAWIGLMKSTPYEAAATTVTLTFLRTAPVWEGSLGGFPALSVVPGQFLVKDAFLFGAALWLLGDALRDITPGR